MGGVFWWPTLYEGEKIDHGMSGKHVILGLLRNRVSKYRILLFSLEQVKWTTYFTDFLTIMFLSF